MGKGQGGAGQEAVTYVAGRGAAHGHMP